MANNILNKNINLIPKYVKLEKQRLKQYNLLLLACVVVVIVFTLLLLNILQGMFFKSMDHNDLKKQINSLGEVVELENNLKDIKSKYEVKKQYSDEIDKKSSNIFSVLDAIDRTKTSAIEISGIVDAKKSATDGKKVIISGRTTNRKAIAQFEESLREEKLFSNVFVPEITDRQLTTNSAMVSEFTIECKFAENTKKSDTAQ